MHLIFLVYFFLTPLCVYSQNNPAPNRSHENEIRQTAHNEILNQYQKELPSTSRGRLSELLIAISYWSLSIEKFQQARMDTSRKIYTNIQEMLTDHNYEQLTDFLGLHYLEGLISEMRENSKVDHIDTHLVHFVEFYMNTNHSTQSIKEGFAGYSYIDLSSAVSGFINPSFPENFWRKIFHKPSRKKASFYMQDIRKDLQEILKKKPQLQREQIFERLQSLEFFTKKDLSQEWGNAINEEFKSFQAHYFDLHKDSDFQGLYEKTLQKLSRDISEKRSKKILRKFAPHSLKAFLLESTPECHKQIDMIHRIIFNRPYLYL